MEGAYHSIMKAMPMERWEQIKRFIHASPTVEEVPHERWFEKMQPLADRVQANCHGQGPDIGKDQLTRDE
jgi:gentisate 1,2-dioxygenase